MIEHGLRYKMIIVDDEEIIRESLAEMVDWISLGFEVIRTFEDGNEVVEFLNNNPVDLVLTDIQMPFMSGLELAEYIHTQLPYVKVVVLSGYREFEYARKAVAYNVSHYLLKPTQIEEISEVFTAIRSEMDKENIEKKKSLEEKKHYQEMIPLLEEQFLMDLVMGALKSEEEIIYRIELIGMNVEPRNHLCCIVSIYFPQYEHYADNSWKYGKDKLYVAMKKFLQKNDGDIRYYPINIRHGNVYILAVAATEKDKVNMEEEVKDHFKQISSAISSLLDMNMDVEFIGLYQSLLDLAMSEIPVAFIGMKSNSFNENEKFIEQQKLFISYINSGNNKAVTNLFNSFMSELKLMEINEIRNFAINLFTILRNKLNEMGFDLDYLSSQGLHYEDISKIDDIQNLQELSNKILDSIVEHVGSNRETSEKNVIQKAKEFIKENCCNDISLEDVADAVFLSPVYLSRLFKQETNENFIDYLTRKRMESAISLLQKTQYKVYEISEMVGYKNTKYFVRLFKQYTGYIPTEFRANN